ncbi:CTI6 [Candida oxycetoniae]|uniref:CTI6 n=1 Tax=Candida oxycetoniae TaxID=497107 RepID=A0AAI9SU77_9ASCO|nr:CTI6 [Candida oxycetoniae]KAI3403107.2 CTI6 [Candida oxycetoniae]
MSRRSVRRSINLDSKTRNELRSDIASQGPKLDNEGRVGSGVDDEESREEEEEEEEGGGEGEDEEGEEGDNENEEEITRCICGLDELQSNLINPDLAQLLKKEFKIEIDSGLFIQCDKCGVWQHGYCVGLYESDDVPDKYWCEQCKPELHTAVKNDSYSVRTLYKPVNDKRRKIEQFGLNEQDDNEEIKSEYHHHNNSGGNGARKGKRNEKSLNTTLQVTTTTTTITTTTTKEKRKERRLHHQHKDEEEYDKQLQKALRESAKESGLVADESDTGRVSPRKRTSRNGTSSATSNSNTKNSAEPSDGTESRPKRFKLDTDAETEVNNSSNNNNNSTNNNSNGSISSSSSKSEIKSESLTSRSKSKRKIKENNIKSSVTSSSSSSSVSSVSGKNNSKQVEQSTNKDELIKSSYKPRYVSSKSTIYDLRKRTSAIIEWIARTQQDLQEEKLHKLELYSFAPDTEKAKEEKTVMESTFNEQGAMIDKLRNMINEWESKFGKYAP